jgi:sRNA-binding regulator protein Hfq
MTFRDAFIWVSLPLVVVSGAIADETLTPKGVPAVAPSAQPPVGQPVPVTETPATTTGVPTLAQPSVGGGAGDGVLIPKTQPQSVTVVLINGSTMTGTISEADQWTMKTSFGTASLPLSAVAGIRMAQEGSTTTTVVLHNGDSITGAVQFDQVVIQTEWGRAEILGTHVASILFTPGLKWSSEPGLNGTRWKLVASDGRTAPPTTQARGMASNRSSARP